MASFLFFWVCHLTSLIGNSALRFMFVVGAWTTTGSATSVALVALFAIVPEIILSPFAGAMIDRMATRWSLQVADLGGLVVVALLTVCTYLGGLQLWQIYATVALLGACAAFQGPALLAAVPSLVREDQYQRVNGLISSARVGAEILGPALGGLAAATSGIRTVLWIDIATFLLALIAATIVPLRGPQKEPPAQAVTPRGLLRESLDGMRDLFSHAGLRALVLVSSAANLVMVLGFAVIPPMVLARTGGDASALAVVSTCTGVGSLAGGLLLVAWGGPTRRARGMLLGIGGMCVSALVVMGASRDAWGWGAAMLVGALLMPMVNSSFQAILQSTISPGRQGRAFGAEAFLSDLSVPIAMILSGTLADRLFEPQAAAGSGVVGLLSPVVGIGPGSGIAALLVIAGLGGVGVAVWGLCLRAPRLLDRVPADAAPAGRPDGTPA